MVKVLFTLFISAITIWILYEVFAVIVDSFKIAIKEVKEYLRKTYKIEKRN
tara:strand:+ start:20278 stop:20430 length:153 start_codon:yes stop_codon:yes gene_type:complete